MNQPTRPRFLILVDDMRSALAAMEPDSVDSIVTDPPYEYGFMGKAWDSTGVAFDPATWAACLRVLKPGGHLLAFGATRTVHRIACAIEDAGFDIRDQIAWMFGSGFPKSLDVSKAIDKAAGATREVVGRHPNPAGNKAGGASLNMAVNGMPLTADITAPASPAAVAWQGWGTALKPAMEPVIVARKPLAGTVAANVLAHGTGAINIDGCRVGDAGGTASVGEPNGRNAVYNDGMGGLGIVDAGKGRWPANVILDDEAGRALDEASGHTTSTDRPRINDADKTGMTRKAAFVSAGFADSGGASRFFYSAKADGAERDAGLERLPVATRADLVDRDEGSAGMANARAGAGRTSTGRRNTHATVKPIDLMRYLCRLVTPPGGVVLDPFFGSGTTGVAAILEGFDVVGVEMDTAHGCIAWHRCDEWSRRQLRPGAKARAGAKAVRKTEGTPNLFGDV